MIDLNADLGEGTGNDQNLLTLVTSASIACGGHAGDTETMTAAVRGAMANGVRIGAHPGFADKPNFGRVRLSLPVDKIIDQVLEQIGALDTLVHRERANLSYVKLHGALANMTAEDDELATVTFQAVADRFPGLEIMALENSAQHRAATALHLPVIVEAYADRAYRGDGLLAPRSLEGAVIHDPDLIVSQCLRLARNGEIATIDGTVLTSNAQSICVHGDTPGALEIARAVKGALQDAGLLALRSAKGGNF